MPTYQYACTECGEQLEVVQKFTDDALTVCPACDGRLRKVFSPVGVVFKGSGFYRTDSRDGARVSNNGSSKASENGSGDTSAAANGSGDTSAAAKASGGNGSSGNGASLSSGATAKKETTAAA
ncbi:MAG TPA: FmdB family zinc ribbon protein [Jiangellaceae bacterium]